MEKQKMITLILGAGWALCEVLNAIPTVKSNSVFEAVYSVIKAISGNDSNSSGNSTGP